MKVKSADTPKNENSAETSGNAFTALAYGVSVWAGQKKHAVDLKSSHELKGNVFNAIAFKAIDVTYEYVLDENSSFGLGIFFKVDQAEVEEAGFMSFEVANNRSYAITPYYRRYFSRWYSNGFFIEGFGMLNSGETVVVDIIFDETQEMEAESAYTKLRISNTYTDFAFGISFGGKITFKNGFLLEFYTVIGIGLNGSDGEAVTRGGLSLGYRF